jgi:hypothetical protein
MEDVCRIETPSSRIGVRLDFGDSGHLRSSCEVDRASRDRKELVFALLGKPGRIDSQGGEMHVETLAG